MPTCFGVSTNPRCSIPNDQKNVTKFYWDVARPTTVYTDETKKTQTTYQYQYVTEVTKAEVKSMGWYNVNKGTSKGGNMWIDGTKDRHWWRRDFEGKTYGERYESFTCTTNECSIIAGKIKANADIRIYMTSELSGYTIHNYYRADTKPYINIWFKWEYPASCKYYTGSTWQPCKISYFNGSTWVECKAKYFNGSTWIDLGV